MAIVISSLENTKAGKGDKEQMGAFAKETVVEMFQY